tara:strand:- start:1889 stop:2950 length:1062 start_codon:yes stop_codon:yes gene_type:complete
MAKFLNKKEQVIDFKLTSYGHYLLSEGTFKPEYYGFFDDNLIYDGHYVGITEKQNEIHKRIKEDTPYIESLVLFEGVEKSSNTLVVVQEPEGGDSMSLKRGQVYFESDYTPTNLIPRQDIFRFEHMIGDAFLEGNTNHAPAWKVVTLDGQISSSDSIDSKNDVIVPQINIDANYRLKITIPGIEDLIGENSFSSIENRTNTFSDGKIITLEQDDVMIYLEELNTILLNDNFDIEVFQVEVDAIPKTHATGNKTDMLIKKTFEKDYHSLKGMEITQEYLDNQSKVSDPFNQNNVGYYFNLKTDHMVNHEKACKSAEIFNRDSYYIDLDFECRKDITEGIYYDIYGPVTEPEICQ